MSLLNTGDGQPRGPNLLASAAPATATAPAEGNRILSQLEHGAAAPAISAARWRPGWWRWAAGGACLAALGVAVFGYEPASAPEPAPVPIPAVARQAAATPVLPTAPAASRQPADARPHAATIVNDAGPPVPVATTPPATAAPTPRKAPPARQAATRVPASRPVTAAPGDSDVALLTAMVAHAQRQDGTAAPARDVVLRREEEETASLLQRCKQLGVIEAMLCRSRICSGRWDSDPACH